MMSDSFIISAGILVVIAVSVGGIGFLIQIRRDRKKMFDEYVEKKARREW